MTTTPPAGQQPGTVTATAEQVEAALRGYLAMLDYDLHKNLECGEETGEDTYAEEAADLFERLHDAAGQQPAAADVTVHELRVGLDDDHRPETAATYTTEQGAAAHGEHLYRAAHGWTADLEWRPTGTDDNPRYRLIAVDDLDGEETDTDWHIVQVTVPAAYTPAGGEQDEPTNADLFTSDELHDMDRADEYAMDAADDIAGGEQA